MRKPNELINALRIASVFFHYEDANEIFVPKPPGNERGSRRNNFWIYHSVTAQELDTLLAQLATEQINFEQQRLEAQDSRIQFIRKKLSAEATNTIIKLLDTMHENRS